MVDDLETTLTRYFRLVAPPGLVDRALRGVPADAPDLAGLAARVRIEATPRGVSWIRLDHRRGPRRPPPSLHQEPMAPAKPALELGFSDRLLDGGGGATGPTRRIAEQARRELAEYLAGGRAFFSVPVDLTGVPDFQARVLHETSQIPFGDVASYADIANRIGHPRAARAVGNALGANPVPVIVPCHRVVRGDGTWGHYLFGERFKTRLLTLERSTPALVGCATTRIVCRHGCAHEQRVREDRRIVFASIGDAESVGYRPCRVCRPDD